MRWKYKVKRFYKCPKKNGLLVDCQFCHICEDEKICEARINKQFVVRRVRDEPITNSESS